LSIFKNTDIKQALTTRKIFLKTLIDFRFFLKNKRINLEKTKHTILLKGASEFFKTNIFEFFSYLDLSKQSEKMLTKFSKNKLNLLSIQYLISMTPHNGCFVSAKRRKKNRGLGKKYQYLN
jgi:hypothetical protein